MIQRVSFGNASLQNLPPVQNYSSSIAGNKILELRKAPPAGNRSYDWLFAHRANAKAAVHALTIVKDSAGQEYVHLLVQKRPPFGGKATIELPAGLWGDSDEKETALQAANREVREETGYDVQSSELMANHLFATSPGMTTERKAFTLTHATGNPSSEYQEPDEKDMITGTMDVPLDTFTDYNRFKGWLQDMDRQGYTVDLTVIAARGLMPPTLGQKLNVDA